MAEKIYKTLTQDVTIAQGELEDQGTFEQELYEGYCICGKITDENQNPMANAAVHLIERQLYTDQTYQTFVVGTAVTDSLGFYAFNLTDIPIHEVPPPLVLEEVSYKILVAEPINPQV